MAKPDDQSEGRSEAEPDEGGNGAQPGDDDRPEEQESKGAQAPDAESSPDSTDEPSPGPADDEHEPDRPSSPPGEGLAPPSPLDGTRLDPLPLTDPSTLPALVAAARQAQAEWGGLPLGERIDAIAQVKRRLLAQAEPLAAAVRHETGKPLEEALLGDVIPNADVVDYWADSIEELLTGAAVELSAVTYPGKHGRIHREPRGVVALITPYNYPLAIPLRTLLPALLSGNAVVFKPSELTPQSGQQLAALFEGLLPKGLLTVVHGGATVGAALVASEVDLVVFTGGVATGRAIARACAERFVPFSLELGGKDAAIVLDDCALERTARGIVWGAFTNTGQNCASIERVYVQKGVADDLIARVVELTKKLRQGEDVSVMTAAAQRQLVVGQLEEAIEAGAEVLAGGLPDSDDDPLAPTVLRVDSNDLALMRDETFGPVLPIMVVDDEQEAIDKANDCRYGLSTSLWTRRVSWAHSLAPRLDSAVVTINNHGFTPALPAAPWTGQGHSGGGITGSPHALSALTRVRFVLEDRNRAKRELWWYPYTPVLRAVALAMAAVRGGVGLVARIVALFTLLTALPKRLFGDDR